jgi:hypothetical protein
MDIDAPSQKPNSSASRRENAAAVRGAFFSDPLDGVAGIVMPSFALLYPAYLTGCIIHMNNGRILHHCAQWIQP